MTGLATGAATSAAWADLQDRFEAHRPALTAHCRRVLGSGVEADDAVQETMVRAWHGHHRFEGRSSLVTWLRSIATNVCLDMRDAPQRRATPADPAAAAMTEHPAVGAGAAALTADPADLAVGREDVRRALVAALLHLPARQRSVLLLCAVLKWRAVEVAELLGTSVASVNSTLQRARATLAQRHGLARPGDDDELDLDDPGRTLLHRYVEAFAHHDVTALTALLHGTGAPGR